MSPLPTGLEGKKGAGLVRRAGGRKTGTPKHGILGTLSILN